MMKYTAEMEKMYCMVIMIMTSFMEIAEQTNFLVA